MDRETIIRDWLINLESGCKDNVTHWAFMEMAFLDPAPDPEEAWACILEGVRRASSEKILGIIGASALENFLAHHGDAFIDRVEREAGVDARFRMVVAHVWRWRISEPVWQRIEKLQAEGGFES